MQIDSNYILAFIAGAIIPIITIIVQSYFENKKINLTSKEKFIERTFNNRFDSIINVYEKMVFAYSELKYYTNLYSFEKIISEEDAMKARDAKEIFMKAKYMAEIWLDDVTIDILDNVANVFKQFVFCLFDNFYKKGEAIRDPEWEHFEKYFLDAKLRLKKIAGTTNLEEHIKKTFGNKNGKTSGKQK